MAARRAVVRRKVDDGKKAAKSSSSSSSWKGTWINEFFAVVCFAAAVFLCVSLVSFAMETRAGITAEASRNLMGPIGHQTGSLLMRSLGWCGLVPSLLMFWLALYFWRLDAAEGGEPFSWKGFFAGSLRGLIGLGGVVTFSCMIVTVAFGEGAGGSLGAETALPLVGWFNTAGTLLIAVALLVVSLSVVTRQGIGSLLLGAGAALVTTVTTVVAVPVMAAPYVARGFGKVFGGLGGRLSALFTRERELEEDRPLPKPRRRKAVVRDEEADAAASSKEADADTATEEEAATHVVVSRRVPNERVREREFVRKVQKDSDDEPADEEDPFKDYRPPALSLLTPGETATSNEDDEELLEKSRLIEAKLRDFGVQGKVTQVHPGPVITLFELEPAPGVKVGRIASLQDDLAMSLRASSIRIIAPIPRRGTVGIEIPNKHRDIVRLRDVLESDAFVNSDSSLTVCLGKDTYGEPMVADIATMPHLLIAGATGTGKSVCINAVLLSLLYRASPAELGLILIDPKILELSVYEGIPHLRVPVVSNPRQAKGVLQWAVDEMHRRYRLMQKFGVRNIDSYNRIVKGEVDPAEEGHRLDDKVVRLSEDAIIEEGTAAPETDDAAEGAEGENGKLVIGETLKPLPKLVVVIDELADLMLAAGREVEELITRLAQKARASGIHLIVATQRPSVDVITGLIKANFPARLAFRVTSRVDSRTILDSMGAERLLGRGDMLLMLPGAESLRRLHGAFVSDSEVKRAVTQIKESCGPKYDERIMRICEKALEEESAEKSGSSGDGMMDDGYDDMYDKAVELVVEKGIASTSMIQRVFRIGYNRAARIIEMMEKEGVVGPMDGAKPREVLVNRQTEGT